ncbi:MAG: TetR family transcriptional regulator [Gammaproteobacteria bacterium]|nr:TetR family transcriptional regulator [Gammaproteobacteria bacterium]
MKKKITRRSVVPRSNDKTYHHGDLRNALVAAAELELKENGLERFSLRGVARAASVSHAAPSHHFGDVQGLLTALTAIGFERLLKVQQKHQKKANDDPLEKLVASGLGYIEFAQKNAEMFHLMFASTMPDRDNADLSQSAAAAFENLVVLVDKVRGRETDQGMSDVYASWALVHGFSALLNANKLPSLGNSKKARDAEMRGVLKRFLAAALN